METQELSDHLVRDGYSADCLHGDLAQTQRDKVMHRFRHKAIKALLATDVAARGIDVKNLTHIIHYHLPDDIENYTHRSGRTARAGQSGISIALLHIKEAYKLHQIEKLAGVKFEKYLIPKGEDVIHSRIKNYVDLFTQVQPKDESIPKFKNEWIWPLMQMDQEELVQRILELEVQKYAGQYAQAHDINVEERVSKSKSDKSFGESRSGSSSTKRSFGKSNGGDQIRLFINLGKKDQLKYDELREVIFKHTKVSGRNVRDIEMKGVYSFFMTDPESADRMCSIRNANFNGRSIRIQNAEDQKEFRERPSQKESSKSFRDKKSSKGKKRR